MFGEFLSWSALSDSDKVDKTTSIIEAKECISNEVLVRDPCVSDVSAREALIM